jgi:hypothetical protein
MEGENKQEEAESKPRQSDGQSPAFLDETPSQLPQEHPHHSHNPIEHKWCKRIRKIFSVESSSGWIALFTLALVVTSTLQWCALRDQSQKMNKALDTNERAWVLVQARGFVMRPPPVGVNPKGYPALTGVMINSGKSPAFKIVYIARVSFELVRPDIPAADSTEWTEGSAGDLLPGGNPPEIIHVFFGPKGFPPEKYTSVESGDLTLFIWIFARYSDPFSDDRFTQKCVRYAPKPIVPTISQNVGGVAFSSLIFCPSRYQVYR